MRLHKIQLLATAVLTVSQIRSVLGCIYPTQPVEKTTFSAGQLALVTWKDDWREPHLRDIGHMRIDLHGNNTEYVATLAKHVSSMWRSHLVLIPLDTESASHYTLRFISTHPPMDIWTADFSITRESYMFPARPAVVNSTVSPTPTGPFSSLPTTTVDVHPNPMGAHPGTPFNKPSKKNTGVKVNLTAVHFIGMLTVLWSTLVGIYTAL